MRTQVQSQALLSGLRIWRFCELWGRSQMWLRSGVALAVAWAIATAPIQPLAWEFPYAADVAIRRKQRKEGREKKVNGGK